MDHMTERHSERGLCVAVGQTTSPEAKESVEDTLRAIQSTRLKSVTAKSGCECGRRYRLGGDECGA